MCLGNVDLHRVRECPDRCDKLLGYLLVVPMCLGNVGFAPSAGVPG